MLLRRLHIGGRITAYGAFSFLCAAAHNKQKRNDCPLVTLGLTLDAAGFPCRSEILPGNVSEPATLAKAISRLGQLHGDGPRPTVIMDAGLSTAETIAWLRAQGYDWITVRRGGEDPPADDPELTFRTRHGSEARAWRLRTADGESELCLWSAERQAKDDAILAQQRERFEGALQALHAGLAKKGCTKRFDKVVERLGRLKERYKRVAGQYAIRVEPAAAETGSLAAAVLWERNDQHARKDARAGTYVLRTSHTDWDLERVARTYWQLTEIEATFRSLKSEIGLRPIWHAKQDRIRAHLFIAVLAYHAVHLLRRRLGAHGCHDSWETIRCKLANWMRLTTTLVTADGELHRVPPGLPPGPGSRRTGPGRRRSTGTAPRPDSHAARLKSTPTEKSCSDILEVRKVSSGWCIRTYGSIKSQNDELGLGRERFAAGRERVRQLMRKKGLAAIYCKPRCSKPCALGSVRGGAR